MKRIFLTLIVAAAAIIIRPGAAQAATLSVSPSSGSYAVGQTFSVTVRVSSPGQALNVAGGTVSFSNNTLTFVSASKNGSILRYWAIDPSGSNASGRVVFSGGLPTPGYKGSGGTVVTLTFKAKEAGTGTVAIASGDILANDGLGTQIYTGGGSARYTVTASTPETPKPTPTPTPTVVYHAPVVSAPGWPDQSKWYIGNEVTFTWPTTGVSASAVAAGVGPVLGVSYSFDRQESTDPDETFEANTGTVTQKITGDGVWYFHIRFKYKDAWSRTTHYRVQRDTTPPKSFTITITYDPKGSAFTPTVNADLTDETSGIALVKMAVDNQSASEVKLPVKLNLTKAGSHHITLTVSDRAGNSVSGETSFTVSGYRPPVITSLNSPMILLDTLIVHGTANAGDVVTIFVDGNDVGQVTAGQVVPKTADGVTITSPWIFASDRPFRPGEHLVTAVATNPEGQTSGPSDAARLFITGKFILFYGHPIATIAAAPVTLIILTALIVLMLFVFTRGWLAIRGLRHREISIDDEIEQLRTRVLRGRMSNAQVESGLEKIEEEIHQDLKRRPRRRSGKPLL